MPLPQHPAAGVILKFSYTLKCVCSVVFACIVCAGVCVYVMCSCIVIQLFGKSSPLKKLFCSLLG